MFKNSKLIRVLQYDIKVLQEQLDDVEYSKASWKRAAEAAKEDLNMWRQKYELSQLTPEVKADTEGAFKRGAEFAKKQAINNLLVMVQNIVTEEPKEGADA